LGRDHAAPTSRLARALRLIVVAAVLLGALLPADASTAFRDGVRLYEAGRFEDAREAFQRAVSTAPSVADHHHWLGKTYGRLAERAPWWRAFGLAHKSRESLERAVALDGEDADALFSLMVFYRSAPAFVGGDKDKARAIERRLHRLGMR